MRAINPRGIYGKISIYYEGGLATRAIHDETKAEIIIEASKFVGGEGSKFTPSDLIAVALGSCGLTLMGIAAKRLDIDISGTRVTVTQEMYKGATTCARLSGASRVGQIDVDFFCPHQLPKEIVDELIEAVHACPVSASLHPSIIQEHAFHWGES